MTIWVCTICNQASHGGTLHDLDCPNHPQARLIALEKRVKELEDKLS